MKRTLFLALLAVLTLSSCRRAQSTVIPTRDITVALSTFSLLHEPLAPARTTNDIYYNPTCLLVLDVVNGQVAQVIERTSDPLADLSLTLTCETHELYLLAAYTPYDSFSAEDLTVSWGTTNRLTYTWARRVVLDVAPSSPETLNIELPIIIGEIDVVCLDEQPADATYMQVSGLLCWTLDLRTMTGIAPTTPWTYNITIANTLANKRLATFSFEPTSGVLSGDLTFTALTSDEQPIRQHSFTEVPVIAGHLTRYTGAFYDTSSSITTTLTTTMSWTETHDYTY